MLNEQRFAAAHQHEARHHAEYSFATHPTSLHGEFLTAQSIPNRQTLQHVELARAYFRDARVELKDGEAELIVASLSARMHARELDFADELIKTCFRFAMESNLEPQNSATSSPRERIIESAVSDHFGNMHVVSAMTRMERYGISIGDRTAEAIVRRLAEGMNIYTPEFGSQLLAACDLLAADPARKWLEGDKGSIPDADISSSVSHVLHKKEMHDRFQRSMDEFHARWERIHEVHVQYLAVAAQARYEAWLAEQALIHYELMAQLRAAEELRNANEKRMNDEKREKESTLPHVFSGREMLSLKTDSRELSTSQLFELKSMGFHNFAEGSVESFLGLQAISLLNLPIGVELKVRRREAFIAA